MKHLSLAILFCSIPCFACAQNQSSLSASNLSFNKDTSAIQHYPQQKHTISFRKRNWLAKEAAAVRFGVKVGMNLSNMNFNKGYPPPAIPAEAAWKRGIAFGLSWQIPLFDKLFLKQEYLFSQMRGEDTRIGTSYFFDYLSLPVLLKYSFLPRFSFVAGPQFELLIQAKESTNSHTSIVTHDTEERSIGVTGGMELQLTKRVSLDARYMHGFNHVGIGQRSVVKEFKYELIQVSTEFLF